MRFFAPSAAILLAAVTLPAQQTAPPLAGTEPFKLGTLMAGIADRGSFRPRLQFGATDTSLTGYVEIYGMPPTGGVIATALELSLAPDGPALASRAANVLMSSDPDRRVATGEIPLDGVAAGDYVLRAVVKLDGQVIGQATRTIRLLRAGS